MTGRMPFVSCIAVTSELLAGRPLVLASCAVSLQFGHKFDMQVNVWTVKGVIHKVHTRVHITQML